MPLQVHVPFDAPRRVPAVPQDPVLLVGAAVIAVADQLNDMVDMRLVHRAACHEPTALGVESVTVHKGERERQRGGERIERRGGEGIEREGIARRDGIARREGIREEGRHNRTRDLGL
jgi:hypothetical protein